MCALPPICVCACPAFTHRTHVKARRVRGSAGVCVCVCVCVLSITLCVCVRERERPCHCTGLISSRVRTHVVVSCAVCVCVCVPLSHTIMCVCCLGNCLHCAAEIGEAPNILPTPPPLQAPPSFLTAPAAAPGVGAMPAAPMLHVPQQVLMDQGLLGPASPIPTPCLLMKNSECVWVWGEDSGGEGCYDIPLCGAHAFEGKGGRGAAAIARMTPDMHAHGQGVARQAGRFNTHTHTCSVHGC